MQPFTLCHVDNVYQQAGSRRTFAFLLCGLLLTACASQPEPLPLETRQRLGKVYLSSAGSTGETFFHADFAKGGAAGSIKGAGKGVVKTLESCASSALSTGVIAPLILLVCTPLMLPANMAAGSAAGATPEVPEEALDSLEQKTNALLQQLDLSPALVARLDEMSQQHTALAQYEISHGTLPLPENGEAVNVIAAKWGYQTVMEVEVTRVGFESDRGRVPMMHLSMTADVRLVEASTGKVIQQQDYHYEGAPQTLSAWYDNHDSNIPKEIGRANQVLSRKIIEHVFTH